MNGTNSRIIPSGRCDLHHIRTALVSVSFLLLASNGWAQAWTATEIPFGTNNSSKWDINNSGDIVGGSGFPYVYHNGALTYLGTLGGSSSGGIAINNTGVIAGYSNVPNPTRTEFHAIRSDLGGGMTDLSAFGHLGSAGWGINDAGTIVGYTLIQETGVLRTTAFQLTAGGVYTDIGVLGGANTSVARAINNTGVVVGNSGAHAFAYDGGSSLLDLGTLPGDVYSLANDINDSGLIVGYSGNAGTSLAFAYIDGVMTDLGTLGGVSSLAMGVNNLGMIVGAAQTSIALGDLSLAAFLYIDDAMIDLNFHLANEREWRLLSAEAINDLGQIVAQGNNGKVYLLSPTDAPIVDRYIPRTPDSTRTVCLMAMGIAVLTLFRRQWAGTY